MLGKQSTNWSASSTCHFQKVLHGFSVLVDQGLQSTALLGISGMLEDYPLKLEGQNTSRQRRRYTASEPHSTLGKGIHGQRYNLNGRLDRVPKVGKDSPGPRPAFTSRLQRTAQMVFRKIRGSLTRGTSVSQSPETCGRLRFPASFSPVLLVTTKCICKTKTAGG